MNTANMKELVEMYRNTKYYKNILDYISAWLNFTQEKEIESIIKRETQKIKEKKDHLSDIDFEI